MTGPERAHLSDAMALIISNLERLEKGQRDTLVDLKQGQSDMRDEMNGWAARFEKQRVEDMAALRSEIGVLRDEVKPVLEFWHHAADGASAVSRVRKLTLPFGGVSLIGYLIAKVNGWIN